MPRKNGSREKVAFDLRKGAEDYIAYASGVSWLHDPIATRRLHGFDVEEEPDTIVERAMDIMKLSSKNIIRNAHGVTRLMLAFKKLPDARKNFDELIEFVYTDESVHSRLDSLLPDSDVLDVYHPAPFSQNPVHDYLAKGRIDKITTPMMMGNVALHPEIELYIIRPKIEVPN